MSEWMNEWINKWMSDWMNEWMYWMNEWMNERGKTWEIKRLKKTAESSVLRGFNVCPMDRPTNRPTDRHDLLLLDDDTHQNQIDYTTNGLIVPYWVKCNGGAESFCSTSSHSNMLGAPRRYWPEIIFLEILGFLWLMDDILSSVDVQKNLGF